MFLKYIVKIIPKKILTQQARKPSGWIGRFVMTEMFSTGNADLNDFVKEMLVPEKADRILEVGFGPGKLIAEMADVTADGLIEGIDFSDTMLKQATKVNRQQIVKGKVKLHQGECRRLPFADNSFHKLCSVNTLYFWEQPEKYLREMLRVLKPQGKIVIGFRDDQQTSRLNFNEEIFSSYSQAEVVNLLLAAGFANAYSAGKDGKPFFSFCAIATKE